VEHPYDELLAEVEAPADAAQQLDLRFHRLRILVRPRHPGAHVLERGVDRLLQERRVARLPAAHDESLGLDPVRRGHGRGIYRGVPTHEPAGTISTRSPPSTRQSEYACSSPASSGATSRGTYPASSVRSSFQIAIAPGSCSFSGSGTSATRRPGSNEASSTAPGLKDTPATRTTRMRALS